MNPKKVARLIRKRVLVPRPEIEPEDQTGHVGRVERTAIRSMRYYRPTCHCGWAGTVTTLRLFAQTELQEGHLDKVKEND
jgi:hypothetical protein